MSTLSHSSPLRDSFLVFCFVGFLFVLPASGCDGPPPRSSGGSEGSAGQLVSMPRKVAWVAWPQAFPGVGDAEQTDSPGLPRSSSSSLVAPRAECTWRELPFRRRASVAVLTWKGWGVEHYTASEWFTLILGPATSKAYVICVTPQFASNAGQIRNISMNGIFVSVLHKMFFP